MARSTRIAICLAVFAAEAGCQGGARFASVVKPGLHIGSTKIGALLLPAEYRALHPELEKLFGQPVMFDPELNGRSTGKMLAAGSIQFAILSAREYAEIPPDTKMEVLCSGLNDNGKSGRKAVIVASTRAGISSLAECKGKRFAFGPQRDLLLDGAAVTALGKAGVALSDLKKEIPPFSLNGRLNVGAGSAEIAKVVALDSSIPCGVVDEITFNSLPSSGGSLLTGASRDMLRVLGETELVPEMVVVAGPKTDPTKAAMLKTFLISQIKNKPEICKQLGVTGFAEADESAYTEARKLLPPA